MRRGMQQQARQSERKREPLPCAKKRRGIISKRQKRFDVRRSTTFFFEQKKSQNENSLLSLSLSLSLYSLSLSLSLYCFHRSRSHPRTHSTDEKRRRRRRRRIYKTLAGNRGGVEMNSHSSLRSPLTVNRKY